MSLCAKRELLSAILTPVEKMGSTNLAGIADQHEPIAGSLLHGVAIVAFFLEGTNTLRLAQSVWIQRTASYRLPEETLRVSLAGRKFFFCVTTPMLVISSVIGICHTQVLVIGRK